MDALKAVNDYNFDTFVPYIAKVTNHWYRDVYFVLEDLNTPLVKSDIEYEEITNERWTLYKTYPDDYSDKNFAGEYKLYAIDKEGLYATNTDDIENYTADKFEKEGDYYLFKGTQDEADDLEIAVIKMPESTDIKEMMEDGILENSSSTRWTAYKEGTMEQEYQQISPDELKEKADVDSELIADKIYYKYSFGGGIIQKDDGVRGETNPIIKKLFLQDKYFAYDGTAEKAEIIMGLRDKIDVGTDGASASELKYGAPVSKDNFSQDEYEIEIFKNSSDPKLHKTVTVKKEHPENDEDEENVYYFDDLINKPTITQDSLSAFSMLENTHTKDADYIYKDFKELIVELGYFTKEELTDATPKLLQWIVPDIGSAGFPKRSLDKKENEFGTFAHSKMDYDINEKNTLKELLKDIQAREQNELQQVNESTNTQEVEGISVNNTQNSTQQVESLSIIDNQSSDINIGSVNNSQNLTNVGTVSSFTRKPSSISVDEFLKTTREMCEFINAEGYDYCIGHDPEDCPTCSETCKENNLHDSDICECTGDGTGNHCKHSPVHDNPCGLSTTFEKSQESLSNHNLCCATLVSWALQNVGVMSENDHQDGANELENWILNNLENTKIIEKDQKLKPGDILCWANGHHIEIVGEKIGENEFTLYNGGDYVKIGAVEYSEDNSCIEKLTGWPGEAKYALRLDWKNAEDGDYEGYLGDEAVVSPVTGILLDYGTYTEEDSGYRKNVDKTDKTDKVGYAKILVLNEEISDQIVECQKVQCPNSQNDAPVAIVNSRDSNGNKTDRLKIPSDIDDINKFFDNLSDMEDSLYGYQLFKDDYENGKIAGYIIYIDGFKCELPAEEPIEKEELVGGYLPETYEIEGREQLSMDYFKDHAAKIKDNGTFEQCSYDYSLYEPDEVHKLLSEKIQAQQELKVEAKAIASNLFEFEGYLDGELTDMLVIKEGTVLGRTITDKELVEDYRGETFIQFKNDDESTDEVKDTEEEERQPEGNYLRIIFKDLDDTVVENVEDYMKLDELQNQDCDFEQLAYFLGCLEEGFYDWMDKGSDYGFEVLEDGAGNTTAFGLTKAVYDLETVKSAFPSFKQHLEDGLVPKEEAQDVFILVLESAKETIQSKLTTPLEDNSPDLMALIDLSHASPSRRDEVIEIYNSKNNNLTADEKIATFSEHWGTNMNYAEGLQHRGTNRGILAAEGRFLLYQEGSLGDEVIFDSKTPWTDFCNGGGTYDLIKESSGIYHVEKEAYDGYSSITY